MAKKNGVWTFKYTAYPTMSRFHHSDARVRAVLGPVGSGKSSGEIAGEVMQRAMRQEPNPEGVRQTRGAMIRNTYTELKTSTWKTFQDWWGFDFVTYHGDSPMKAVIRFPMQDGTTVECEVLFIAMDKPEDVGKLRSVEFTWIYINEASEIHDKSIFDACNERIGRYPKHWEDENGNDAGGATWCGIFMDSNAPDDEHWVYELFEVKKPEGFEIFHQPPAVLLKEGITPDEADALGAAAWEPNKGQRAGIPPAENIEHLGKAGSGWDYYMKMLPGKSYDQIRVMLQGEYGTVAYGRSVYPNYNDQLYYMPNKKGEDGKAKDVKVYGGLPIIIGFDFGIQYSAAVFAQLSQQFQLRVIEEMVLKDCTSRDLAQYVLAKCRNEYKNLPIIGRADPAGMSRAQTDGNFNIQILNEMGIPTLPCITQSPKERIESVKFFMSKLCANGEPGLVIGSKCPMIRKGFAGRYYYKKVSTSGADAVYRSEPFKNEYSHPHDALQYIAASCVIDENTRTAATQVTGSGFGSIYAQETQRSPLGVDSGGIY